jgi:hypothetical protein
MKRAGKTPPFRDPRGEPVPGSIAEVRYLRIGGIDQWAPIRGERAVPPETSLRYFDALTAPSKTLVWFEESGYEPFVDEPAKFYAAMVEMVRPAEVVPQ